MAIRDTIRATAARLLEPGETIQAVIPAQTINAWLGLLVYWIIVFNSPYRVIIVTDQRILVCRSSRFRIAHVTEVLHVLPRATQIGPPTGLWYRYEGLGERLYIHRRFHVDVLAADSAA